MATDPRVETLARLASIDVTLKAILLVLSEGRNGQASAPAVPDRLLEGQYGDPVVKAKDPRDWAGIGQQGKHFSECPPDYLDLVADRCEHFVRKNTEALNDVQDGEEEAKLRKDIKYGTLDAQRARGWAARLRGGWVAPTRTVDETQGEPRW